MTALQALVAGLIAAALLGGVLLIACIREDEREWREAAA